jgi:hypothetical protein
MMLLLESDTHCGPSALASGIRARAAIQQSANRVPVTGGHGLH